MDRWRTDFRGGTWRKRRCARRFRRGQTIVLMALAIPMLLGALALGVDVGLMYLNWVLLQKAADGAVLAGANSLPGAPSSAVTVTNLWATNNGVKAAEITATTVASDDMSVTISVQRTVPYNFAHVLGLASQQISVTATAGVMQNPAGVSGLIPIGLSCDSGQGVGDCAYAPGWYQLKGSQVGAGNWAPLEFGGTPGANAYRSYMKLGFTGTIPSVVPTETGNIVGPTGQAIDQRISKGVAMNPTASYTNPPAYDPRLVAVPLVQFNDPNGKKPVNIVGYAEMWVGSVTGNNNTINVYFIGWLSQPSSSDSPSSFGINTPVLLH